MNNLTKRDKHIPAALLKQLLVINLSDEMCTEIKQWWGEQNSIDANNATLEVVCYEMNMDEEGFESGLVECHIDVKILGHIK